MLRAKKLAGIIENLQRRNDLKIPTKIKFTRFYPDFTPILIRFSENFDTFSNSITFEPHIVEICMTTQIKAIPMDFMHKLSSLLQRMPIFPNPPPKLAQKRDNRENRKICKKRGKSVILAFFSKAQKFIMKYIF